jgi:ferrochelatase
MRAKEDFEKNGGENFFAVPCLNDDEQWCKTVSNWINDWADKK